MRTIKLAFVIVTLAACAGVPRRAAPPANAPWIVYPEADVKGWENPHDYKGAALCQRCHASPDGKLVVADPPDLCYQCHAAARMTHVNKIQKPLPPTLPYAAGGRIVCHTCHEVHEVKTRKYRFRDTPLTLCLECHKRH